MPAAAPFRFGLSAPGVRSRHALQELARRVEDAGWSTLLLPDHLGAPSSFAALICAAEATTDLRVGTLVLNNDFFHPLRLAQEAATVDLLTDGRLELGLGSGWAAGEYQALGLAYDRPQVRAARLADAVDAMKAAWSGEVTISSAAGTVAAVPSPAQRPHPPLLIGGHGDAILALAAREADMVGLTGLTWTGTELAATGASLRALAERAEFVRHQARHRARPPELNLLVQVVSVGRPLDQQADQAAAYLSVSPELVRTSPLALVGTEAEVAEKLVMVREHTGISYVAVFEAAFEQMLPVVTRLAGT